MRNMFPLQQTAFTVAVDLDDRTPVMNHIAISSNFLLQPIPEKTLPNKFANVSVLGHETISW